MPTSSIKSLAKRAKVSVKAADKKWEEAKAIVDKEYPNVEKGSDQYYQLVMAITESMLGLRKKKKKVSTESDDDVVMLWGEED